MSSYQQHRASKQLKARHIFHFLKNFAKRSIMFQFNKYNRFNPNENSINGDLYLALVFAFEYI